MDDTGSTTPRKSDFTIEHILNRAGVRENFVNNETVPTVMFPWLQCTRYCPPKIPSEFYNKKIASSSLCADLNIINKKFAAPEMLSAHK